MVTELDLLLVLYEIPELLYFEWSPPWHLFVIVSDISLSGYIYMYIWYNLLTFYLAFYSDILSDIYSDFLSGIYTDIFSGILSGIFSAICSGMLSSILSDILFWHSIWYFFGHSLWLRSGGKHSDPELAVEVRRGTLWSGACGGGPEWNTLIQKLLLGSGGEHCDLALAVEGPARSGGRRKEEGRRKEAGWLT